MHYKIIINSGSELKIFQLFGVQNWEAMLTLLSEAILEMHQTMLRLVKMGVLLEESPLHGWQSVQLIRENKL